MAQLIPIRTFQMKRGDDLIIVKRGEKIEVSDEEHRKLAFGYFKQPYKGKKVLK